MPTARLNANFSQSNIDTETGIIRGVRVMQNGVLACFAGEKGEAKKVTISPAHIEALLKHAGNKAIPSHLSHDWHGSESDAIHSRIGVLKNFAKDSVGNLVADLHLSPGSYRETALWNAAEAPESMMLSAVFNYSKDDPKCMPLDFQACDLVANGAATTALFSEAETPNQNMDINELIAALADPKVQAAVGAIIKSHKADAPDTSDEEAPAAEMEKEAGVTDADKKDSDDQKPALMRASLRVSRCVSRKISELAANETAILAKAKLDAEAASTALLGKSGAGFKPAGEAKGKDAFDNAVKAEMEKTPGISLGRAKFNVAKLQPELYGQHTALLNAAQ